MFKPTHWLVSRHQKTPVQLLPSTQGFGLLTEPEFQQNRHPAFELRNRLGIFCQGVQVVGYHLEPMAIAPDPHPVHPEMAHQPQAI